MKARFIGVPGEYHEGVNAYGTYYPLNKWQPVTDRLGKVKLANHPHFEADTADEDIEDAKIKGELEASMSPVLAQVEAQKVANQQAADEQAKANAEADERHDEKLEAQVLDSALAFQNAIDAPVVAAPVTEATSALEYQQATQYPSGVTNGNAQRLGDSDAAEAASAGAGRSGKPGRPRKGG